MKYITASRYILYPVAFLWRKRNAIIDFFNWGSWESEKRKAFFINISIGVIIGVFFHFAGTRQSMENLLNVTIDKMVYWESYSFFHRWGSCVDKPPKDKGCAEIRNKISKNIGFIDIDEQTDAGWGEPLFIPRDKIAQFIILAEHNKAKVIIFDIIFDHPSNNPAADSELRKVLKNLTERKSSLKIVFPVLKGKKDGRLKKNIFDEFIEKNPNFHRALPYVSTSILDKIVRYIRFYDIAKKQNGERIVLWGSHFLSTILFTDDESKLQPLENKILEDYKKHKVGRYAIELSNGIKLHIANNELFSNRIRFSLLPPGIFGSEGNLFTERILPDEIKALQKNLHNKIVIIGTSSSDKESWYPTPVGEMAGIYIIGNIVNMLSGNWQIRDAPPWINLLTELLVILFASYMFVHFQPSVARIISTLLLLILLIPVTYHFYAQHGIFINSIFLFMNSLLPVLGMGWRRILAFIEGLIAIKGKIFYRR